MSHSAFRLLRTVFIESLNLTVQEFVHEATGALHYHFASDNNENVFLVALRTVPTDSTGVAHILEHTALCGSERYPVRDPFFMMIRRSLNTFMNAFTSSDWTAYPFASQNKKDFNNLLDVYLDAVFFSRLHELDFAQEGHRVEFSKIDDPNSELVFKGVVFNEMKGAMSSPVSQLWHHVTTELFPTTTYHYNSGGEPENIPDLTYSQLVAFYKKHYHPSNAIFMTYGDIDAKEHQATFEKLVLSRFEKSNEQITIADEHPFTKPLVIEKKYALDKSEDANNKTHIVIAWKLGHSCDLDAMLEAELLSQVLLEDSSCPLMHALETTDLGSAPSPLCELETTNKEMTFMCGVEGSSPQHADAVEKLIFNVLNVVATQGVPQEKIEAMLHQIELDQREVSGGSYPYGLQIIMGALPAAIHRGDPIGRLNIDEALIRIRKKISDPNYIKQLTKKLLIDNNHRIRITLRPDQNLGDEIVATEKERLAIIKKSLSAQDQQRIVELGRALEERQLKKDDPTILPKVSLSDIPKHMNVASGETKKHGKIAVNRYAQGTNGLVYQDIIFELPQLSDEQQLALNYYTSCLTEVGVGEHDYLATQEWQTRVSGSVNGYATIRSAINDEQKIKGQFVLSGKGLVRNHDQLSQLLNATITKVKFNEYDRLRELISQMRAAREQSITGNGHTYAMQAACSQLSPVSAITHRLDGLQSIAHIKQLDLSLKDDAQIKKLSAQFQSLHELIASSNKQFLLIAEHNHLDQFTQEITNHWVGEDNGISHSQFSLPSIRQHTQQGWVTSTQVNFCAKAYATVPVEHEDAATLTVLSHVLRNGYLHRAIREKGGAYGGGAAHDSESATFRFYSYRDPRLSETFADFDHAIHWMLDEKHEWQVVEEAILGVMGGLDKPSSPAGEARKAFYNLQFGRTPEQRQRFRERVLAVNLDKLRTVTEKYLLNKPSSSAVVTNSAGQDQIKKLGLEVITL